MSVLEELARALQGQQAQDRLPKDFQGIVPPVRQPRPPQLMAPQDLPRQDQRAVANTSGMPEFMGVGDSPPVRAEMPDLMGKGAVRAVNAAGRGSRERFAQKGFDAVGEGHKSRSKVVDMNIDEFLKLAAPMDHAGLPAAGEAIARGDKLSEIPHLWTSSEKGLAKVHAHEGRNRAIALKKLGFDTMPVEIRDTNIRFSEQLDPKNIDFIDEFPTRLQAEKGTFETAFPITRELPEGVTIPKREAAAAPPTPKRAPTTHNTDAETRLLDDLLGMLKR